MNEEKSTRDRIFEFVVHYKRKHDGGAPSIREIAKASCVAVSTVHYHLLKLESEGRIRLSGERKSGIEVVGASWIYSGPDTDPGEHHADGEADAAYSPTT